jgi:hypothetical protein
MIQGRVQHCIARALEPTSIYRFFYALAFSAVVSLLYRPALSLSFISAPCLTVITAGPVSPARVEVRDGELNAVCCAAPCGIFRRVMR